jgi:hypothetical protein
MGRRSIWRRAKSDADRANGKRSWLKVVRLRDQSVPDRYLDENVIIESANDGEEPDFFVLSADGLRLGYEGQGTPADEQAVRDEALKTARFLELKIDEEAVKARESGNGGPPPPGS